MKKFTIANIRSWKPCYGPEKWLAEDWSGTAIDILKDDRIPFSDRLWVVLRTDLISERTIRLFAVWSARQCEKFVPENDRKKFSDILDVIQRFAMGEATENERDAAWDAARDASLGRSWGRSLGRS